MEFKEMENDNQNLDIQEEDYDDYEEEDNVNVDELDKQIKLWCSSTFTILLFVIGIGLNLLILCAEGFDLLTIIAAHILYSPFYIVGTILAVFGLYMDSDSKVCLLGLILNGIPTLIALILFLGLILG